MERELLYKIAAEIFTEYYLKKLAKQKLAQVVVDYRRITKGK